MESPDINPIDHEGLHTPKSEAKDEEAAHRRDSLKEHWRAQLTLDRLVRQGGDKSLSGSLQSQSLTNGPF